MERATGAVIVTHTEVKDLSLQKSKFGVEWEKGGKAIPMAIEVANGALLMSTKQKTLWGRKFTAGQGERCQFSVTE